MYHNTRGHRRRLIQNCSDNAARFSRSLFLLGLRWWVSVLGTGEATIEIPYGTLKMSTGTRLCALAISPESRTSTKRDSERAYVFEKPISVFFIPR